MIELVVSIRCLLMIAIDRHTFKSFKMHSFIRLLRTLNRIVMCIDELNEQQTLSRSFIIWLYFIIHHLLRALIHQFFFSLFNIRVEHIESKVQIKIWIFQHLFQCEYRNAWFSKYPIWKFDKFIGLFLFWTKRAFNWA